MVSLSFLMKLETLILIHIVLHSFKCFKFSLLVLIIRNTGEWCWEQWGVHLAILLCNFTACNLAITLLNLALQNKFSAQGILGDPVRFLPSLTSHESSQLPRQNCHNISQLTEKMKTFKLELSNKWHPAPLSGHSGSVTSSSQSSDDSEDGARLTRLTRHRPGPANGQHSRSSSLPRHSSAGQYKRSITMPNIRREGEISVITNNYSGQYNNNPVGRDLTGQIDPIRGHNNNVQLTTWLQSLTGIPHTSWPGTQSGKSAAKYPH